MTKTITTTSHARVLLETFSKISKLLEHDALLAWNFYAYEINWSEEIGLCFGLGARVRIEIMIADVANGGAGRIVVRPTINWASGGGDPSEALAQLSHNMEIVAKVAKVEMILNAGFRSAGARSHGPLPAGGWRAIFSELAEISEAARVAEAERHTAHATTEDWTEDQAEAAEIRERRTP